MQTKILFTVPLKETLIFWRLGEKVRFEIPVIFLPTPPFFLALPRREMLLPARVPLPQTAQTRDIATSVNLSHNDNTAQPRMQVKFS